jgi:hypothetical protein
MQFDRAAQSGRPLVANHQFRDGLLPTRCTIAISAANRRPMCPSGLTISFYSIVLRDNVPLSN